MKLLLDIGNSRLKWALADEAGLRDVGALEHGGDPTVAIAQIPDGADGAVLVSQVMGVKHEPAILRALRRRFGAVPRLARVEPECAGLRVAYAEPQRLGVDRWLGMLALWTESRAAFCVASAGTALTFDAVDGNGQHLGGLIAAGLRAQQLAVLGATRFDLQDGAPRYSGRLGTDTESCVSEASLFACIGLLERAGTDSPRRVLCGGDAATLAPHLSGWTLRPDLVLEGLLAWNSWERL